MYKNIYTRAHTQTAQLFEQEENVDEIIVTRMYSILLFHPTNRKTFVKIDATHCQILTLYEHLKNLLFVRLNSRKNVFFVPGASEKEFQLRECCSTVVEKGDGFIMTMYVRKKICSFLSIYSAILAFQCNTSKTYDRFDSIESIRYHGRSVGITIGN